MTRIIITAGDCNGIGLETLFAVLRRPDWNAQLGEIELSIVVHPATLHDYARQLGVDVAFYGDTANIEGKECMIYSCEHQALVQFGQSTTDAGRMAWQALEIAALKLQAKEADAVVTLPVSKYTLQKAGYPFPGQTEFFAARALVKNPLMLLCTGIGETQTPVRVGLATIHIPLSEVSGAVSMELLQFRIAQMDKSLQEDFGIAKPRIAVLGLNPHAGEDGLIGDEEQRVIHPAITIAQQQGIGVEGAFPADGFFAFGAYKKFDGIIAMYHDQGLIPLKLLAGGSGVNVTCGLPIIRTSPDHGTAYNIAGAKRADPKSLWEAIQMAGCIFINRNPECGKNLL